MKFVDLGEQYNRYKEEIDKGIQDVISNTSFINGKQNRDLEDQLSEFAGVKNSIVCSSGTDALLIPLMAYDIQPGDEIIVPAFTYIATVSMVAFYKATPVFVDVDPITFNLDSSKIEEKITDKTKGIIAVSLYGQCADFDEIKKIAQRHNLWVMEDGAQSFGAVYKGKKSCSLTDVASTSFFPAKPLGCYGDGGAIFTNNDELAAKMRKLINHGQEKRYYHKYIGLNSRMDSLQAAIVSVKLKYFSQEIELRNKVAEIYSKNLEGIVAIPTILKDNCSTWAQYTIRLDKRDKLREFLSSKNIPSAVHYPMPVYKQEAFKYLNVNEGFAVSEQLANTVMSLPMHSFLMEDEILEVVGAIKEFLC